MPLLSPWAHCSLQVHEALHFSPQNEGQRMGREFGIWSIKWSGDGREIIAGTNDEVGRGINLQHFMGAVQHFLKWIQEYEKRCSGVEGRRDGDHRGHK